MMEKHTSKPGSNYAQVHWRQEWLPEDLVSERHKEEIWCSLCQGWHQLRSYFEKGTIWEWKAREQILEIGIGDTSHHLCIKIDCAEWQRCPINTVDLEALLAELKAFSYLLTMSSN